MTRTDVVVFGDVGGLRCIIPTDEKQMKIQMENGTESENKR